MSYSSSASISSRTQSNAEGGRPLLYGQRAASEQGRHRADRLSHRKTKHDQEGPVDRGQ